MKFEPSRSVCARDTAWEWSRKGQHRTFQKDSQIPCSAGHELEIRVYINRCTGKSPYQPEVAVAQLYLYDMSEGKKCKIGNCSQNNLKGAE